MLPFTVSCTSGNILVSDHAMVSLNLVSADNIKTSARWRFNSSLLQDDAFKAMLKTQIDLFIKRNVPSSPSAGTTLEAFKAFIRGNVIQFSSHMKKQNMRRLAALEKKVVVLLSTSNLYSYIYHCCQHREWIVEQTHTQRLPAI